MVSQEEYDAILERVNYTEEKVPGYRLPSALETGGKGTVRTAGEWLNTRRAEVLELFREHVYGRPLPRPDELRFELLSSRNDALGGLACRKEVRIHCRMRDGKAHKMDLLLYLPSAATAPVPVFLGLNFKGNQAASPESDILMPECWFRDDPDPEKYREGRALEKSRNCNSSCWPFVTAIKRGYGMATVCYHEIFPDHENGWDDSVYSLFYSAGEMRAPQRPFGAVGAWGWGLSRALDYLESEVMVAADRVAVLGHSRLGKAALWAAASDLRFALAVSNNSGCGGAKITRRYYGETLEYIQNVCPHWFSTGFRQYIGREDALPVDQHMLISLLAPRPAYIASAVEDTWADPKGEFLSAVHAQPIYGLFGGAGLGTEEMPGLDTSIGAELGYHIRSGDHDITAFDWNCYFDFADRHFHHTAQ